MGGVFVPVHPVNLPPGELVQVVLQPALDAVATPADLRRAMHEPPHLDPGDAAALEESMAAGRKPMRFTGEFDDDLDQRP